MSSHDIMVDDTILRLPVVGKSDSITIQAKRHVQREQHLVRDEQLIDLGEKIHTNVHATKLDATLVKMMISVLGAAGTMALNAKIDDHSMRYCWMAGDDLG